LYTISNLIEMEVDMFINIRFHSSIFFPTSARTHQPVRVGPGAQREGEGTHPCGRAYFRADAWSRPLGRIDVRVDTSILSQVTS
jgi:hypothetical protein